MKHVYNTGKVQIGLMYEPPRRREFSLDEERIQTALLSKPSKRGGLLVALLVSVASVSAVFITITL